MFTSTSATDPPLAALSSAAGSLVARVRGGAVAGGAVAGASVDSLGQTLVELRRVQAKLDWAVLQVVREVDLGQGYRADGALSARSWLTQRVRMGRREAADSVCAARGLGSGALGATSKALSEGAMDLEHAVVIARGAVAAPDGAVSLIEPFALAEAQAAEPAKVADVMREFRNALDPDDADRAAVRRYDRRGLSTATTLDGSLAGRFLLDPGTGSTVLTALHAATPLTPGDTRTAAQRRADALGIVAEHFLQTAQVARTAGARPPVIVTRRAPGTGSSLTGPPNSSWLDGSTRPDDAVLARPISAVPTTPDVGDPTSGGSALRDASRSRMSWIGPVPESTADRIGCDATHTVVDVDPDGEVTAMTRERRYFTWNQRLAMIGRDGDRCPWPHCDRPIWWSDGHHLVPVSEGGPTTVANGALPCEAHHVLLHEGHWTLQRLRDGHYLARDRRGHLIGPERNSRVRGKPVNGTLPTPHRRE